MLQGASSLTPGMPEAGRGPGWMEPADGRCRVWCHSTARRSAAGSGCRMRWRRSCGERVNSQSTRGRSWSSGSRCWPAHSQAITFCQWCVSSWSWASRVAWSASSSLSEPPKVWSCLHRQEAVVHPSGEAGGDEGPISGSAHGAARPEVGQQRHLGAVRAGEPPCVAAVGQREQEVGQRPGHGDQQVHQQPADAAAAIPGPQRTVPRLLSDEPEGGVVRVGDQLGSQQIDGLVEGAEPLAERAGADAVGLDGGEDAQEAALAITDRGDGGGGGHVRAHRSGSRGDPDDGAKPASRCALLGRLHGGTCGGRCVRPCVRAAVMSEQGPARSHLKACRCDTLCRDCKAASGNRQPFSALCPSGQTEPVLSED